jgi:hypothetical protein
MYNHPRSNQVRMKTTKERGEESSPVYVRSVDHIWVPAVQLKVHPCGRKATIAVPKLMNEHDMLHGTKVSRTTYQNQDHQIVSLSDYPNNVLPMQNVDCHGNLQDYMDMVDLPFMHEVSAGRMQMDSTP